MEDIPEKDQKYVKHYVPNEIYWGLGIENETYFILKNATNKTGSYIKKNRKRERYSVDYSISYDQDKLLTYLNQVYFDNDIYRIPQYVNSHTLSKTDINGEHITLYSIGKTPNPKFSGKTIHEKMKEFNEKFINDLDHKYVFDGDTIEFITQKFYKTSVNDCVSELIDYKKNFLDVTNQFMHQNGLPMLDYPKVNYGLVQFKTNPNNIALFNNGTYHFNITMPTKLNENSQIEDMELFHRQHRNAVIALKWMEPFLIALYGSPDVFSFHDNNKYSAGSLRLTASRYIGVGTYDTETMKSGKILNNLKTEFKYYKNTNSWYNQIYQKTDYKQCENIGYDFNFMKHYQLGIEFRIFDYFPEEALGDLLNLIILILDHSVENEISEDVDQHQAWHNFTADVLINGHTAKIPYQLALLNHHILHLPLIIESNICHYFSALIDFLYDKYCDSICSRNMSPQMVKPKLHNVNQYMWDNNYLQYIPINNKNHIRVKNLYDIYQRIHDESQIFVMDYHDKIHCLFRKLELHTQKNLNLEDFYQFLLKKSESIMDINNYLLIK